MIDLTSIVKSSTFITICIGIILISGLMVTIHLIIKNKEKRKQKQNTKELNDTLTMEILNEKNSPVVVLPEKESVEKVSIEEKPVVVIDKEEPKIDVVEELSKEVEKSKEDIELLESTKIEEQQVQIAEDNQEVNIIGEVLDSNPEDNTSELKEEIKKEETVSKYEVNEEENLVYAPIELDEEEAKEALEKLTMELSLKEQEEQQEELLEEEKNITLTNFEREQEENAIISLDELMERGREIYNNNEAVGYDDEGDEPITIEQLQERWEKEKQTISQIELEEKIEEIESNKEEIKENIVVNKTDSIQSTVIVPEKAEIKDNNTETSKVVRKVEFPSILPNKKDVYETKFTNSPIISPVYGIERKKFEEEEKLHPEKINKNDLELENTANYEKFDEEIKKTNEFIAALKELQKKLD